MERRFRALSPSRCGAHLRGLGDVPHGHVVHFETSAHFRFDAVLEVKLEELVELHDADHRVLLPAYLLELLLRLSAQL